MEIDSLLIQLLLAYSLALVLLVAGGRIGLPPIIALIASGTLAGPFALGIVSTPEDVDALAEIGIVLLLFTVGLEFPLHEMRRLWKTVASAGFLQVGGSATAATVVAIAAGVPFGSAVFVGLFVALSSTAIVLKELGRSNRLDSPAGRITTGILLFQDLCVVLLLLAAPMMAGAVDPSEIPGVVGRAAVALVGVVLVGRFVLPVLFRLVAASGQREAFALAVLVASVGTAVMSAGLGLSAALGAFLAGLMLGGSEFSHQAHAEVRPLRDILTSLFFISLGMLVDPVTLLSNFPIILAIAFGTILAKAVIAGGAVTLTGGSLRAATASGFYLAQIGEFSFVLGRDGLELGVLPPAIWELLLPASIITMVVTPPLLNLGPRVADWVASRRPTPADTDTGAAIAAHVIILGFGIGGRMVASSLKRLNLPYHVIDVNGASVRKARAEGEPVTFGDATSPDTLRAVGVADARAIVIVLSDPDASLKAVRTITQLAPLVPVFVRARYRLEADRLRALGAIAVTEELESSLEVLAQLLVNLQVPGNVIEATVEGYRHRDELKVPRSGAPRVPLEALAEDILAAPVASHQIGEHDWANGRTLSDLHLRSETGASVLAVKRDGEMFTSIEPNFTLQQDDVLFLLGDETHVRRARTRLSVTPDDGR